MVRKSNQNTDEKLIKILEENSRLSYTKIGKILGLSEAAIRKKISKLVKKGIIKKFTVEIDWKKIGKNLAIVGFDVVPEYLEKVIDNVKKIENVKKFYLSSGDHTFLVELLYKDKDEIKKFVKTLKKIKGVKRVCPSVLVEEL